MHTLVKTLPTSIQAALHVVGYRKPDVELQARETVSVAGCGSQGRRAFVVLLDLENGRSESHYGSWGGPNMFNPTNAVDLDDTERAIIPGMAVIKGSEGHHGTWATVYLHPSNVIMALPTVDVTERERAILDTFGYKSGYRQEQWREMGVTPAELDTLVERGYVSKNKAGAMALTTDGKNARKR